jgi:hypothetical protein
LSNVWRILPQISWYTWNLSLFILSEVLRI